MLAGEARAIAARWLEQRLLPATPSGGVRGAYVMGSLAALDDADGFDEVASDIDLAIVVDPDLITIDRDRYPHGTFALFSGCIVQANFVSQHVLEADEQLFGMIGLGCNLRHGRIIFDPAGVVAAAQSRILERWADPQWRTHRTERAITFARAALTRMDEGRNGAEDLAHLCELVMQLAGLVAIASGTTPTHRRALVLARTLLEPLGRADLAERMLAAVGAEDADEAFISECTNDAVAAAQVVPHDLTEWSDELATSMTVTVSAGIRQLVEEGYVREAALPALACVASCGADVSDRASAADRMTLDTLIQRRLRKRPDALLPSFERRRLLGLLFDDVAEFSRNLARS